MSILPTDAAERKRIPIFSGVLAYFPRALAEVAKVSRAGNEQHHPGQPLHWDKSKSTDHMDALLRHLVDALDASANGIVPTHELAQVAWRALAELETRLEKQNNLGSPGGNGKNILHFGKFEAACGGWTPPFAKS